MKKIYYLIMLAIVVIIALGCFLYRMDLFKKAETPTPITSTVSTSTNTNLPATTTESNIQVSSPKAGDIIKSPFVVLGEARGSWYFEASFPVQLVNSQGQVIAETPAAAQGEWMTENFVPFMAKLIFTATTTEPGELVLKKDNPSGLPQNDAEIRIPVTIQSGPVAERTVKLFYYNSSQDQDSTGNILCSKKGLVAVERKIPVTKTPIQDTINLLLQGQLTATEKAASTTTEYSLPGLALTGASLTNGVLTLSFVDPNNKTSGGSCRAGILWSQIEATAKQFDSVKEVKFTPEDLFQP